MSKDAKKSLENPGEAESAASPKPLRYIGPIPASRIGNLPGVHGTKAADKLIQEEIAFVIATSAVLDVAKWWTSDSSALNQT